MTALLPFQWTDVAETSNILIIGNRGSPKEELLNEMIDHLELPVYSSDDPSLSTDDFERILHNRSEHPMESSIICLSDAVTDFRATAVKDLWCRPKLYRICNICKISFLPGFPIFLDGNVDWLFVFGNIGTRNIHKLCERFSGDKLRFFVKQAFENATGNGDCLVIRHTGPVTFFCHRMKMSLQNRRPSPVLPKLSAQFKPKQD